MSAPGPVTFPCGCFLFPHVADDGVRELRVSACRQDCRNLALVLQEVHKQGKPVIKEVR